MSGNNTTNTTAITTIIPNNPSDIRIILSSIFVTIVTLATVIGNSMVIFCVCYFPRLRGRTNYLIVSLAVADWLIGMLSNPFKLLQTLNGRKWPENLNSSGCEFWIWIDMLCSAVSITSLMAISIDRLIAITDPLKYEGRMRPRHIYAMIGMTWVFSSICASLSLVEWKNEPVIKSKQACSIQSKEYVTFVSTAAFFIPLVVVFFNYALIFRVAIRHARRLNKEHVSLAVNYRQDLYGVDTNHNGNSDNPQSSQTKTGLLQHTRESFTRQNAKKPNRTAKLSLVKQLKATKTLAVVVGVFTICWLPFFIMFVTFQHCSECFSKQVIDPSLLEVLSTIFIDVLPVANSAANPIIYTCFNVEFRKAFKKILRKILRISRSIDDFNTTFSTVPTSFHCQRDDLAESQTAV